MSVLDGRAMAAQIREDLKGEVSALRARGVVPALAVVMLGDDPAARAYVRGIERASAAVDVACTVHRLPADAAHEDLARTLDELSADPAVHGIILQTPLPSQIDGMRIGAHTAVRKDVDGINPTSAGHLLLGLPSYPPATAAAVMEILRRAAIPLRGRQAVVIGRVAIGRARHVGAAFVKPGATVIDVGINEVDGGIVGDVDYDAVAPIAGAITPVPGGVGPLTNVMLLRNTVAAAREAASLT